jgi:hypothetical protein
MTRREGLPRLRVTGQPAIDVMFDGQVVGVTFWAWRFRRCIHALDQWRSYGPIVEICAP